jgi:hypothetical protein
MSTGRPIAHYKTFCERCNELIASSYNATYKDHGQEIRFQVCSKCRNAEAARREHAKLQAKRAKEVRPVEIARPEPREPERRATSSSNNDLNQVIGAVAIGLIALAVVFWKVIATVLGVVVAGAVVHSIWHRRINRPLELVIKLLIFITGLVACGLALWYTGKLVIYIIG